MSLAVTIRSHDRAGPMRTDIYRRIVAASGLVPTPAEAWLLSRIAIEQAA